MIDPWGSKLVWDYERVIKEFGMSPFDSEILSKFPNPNKPMRRFVIFGHQELEIIAEAIKKRKEFAVLTGIMPSARKLHLGNKLVVEMVKYFQEHGAKTYLLAADLEALATRKIPLKILKERAKSFYFPAYLALGLDKRKTEFYFQSENEVVKNFSYEISDKLTLPELRAIYGELSTGKILSVLTQIADILYPQLEKPKPVVVPVGVDQSPHLRATRDVARRSKKYGFFLASASYHKFTPSLDGSNYKMSKSKTEARIDIPEEPEKAAGKVFKAKTGGRKTLQEQKKLGGIPSECIIFEFLKQHLLEDDRELEDIFHSCKSGSLFCGDCKEKAANLMQKFMEKFLKEFRKARKNFD